MLSRRRRYKLLSTTLSPNSTVASWMEYGSVFTFVRRTFKVQIFFASCFIDSLGGRRVSFEEYCTLIGHFLTRKHGRVLVGAQDNPSFYVRSSHAQLTSSTRRLKYVLLSKTNADVESTASLTC